MVTQQVFDAISDPTRRSILESLRGRERSAGDIARLFPISRPAVSRHIRVLRSAGLVLERREAQARIYALDARPLEALEQWVQHYRVFWGARLHDLKQDVESHEAPKPNPETEAE